MGHDLDCLDEAGVVHDKITSMRGNVLMKYGKQ